MSDREPPPSIRLPRPPSDIPISEKPDEEPPQSGGRSPSRIPLLSLAPPGSPARPSLAPRLPGVVLNPTEATVGSVGVVTGTLQALRRLERQEVLRQIVEIGLQSLGFICLVLGFVGSILVYQAGLQALRIVPDTSNIGSNYLELLVKDLAASITGLMLATRVGAGIAAEIGSMKVTDQLDALRLCRTDPVAYLVAPRVVASVITTPLLTIFGGAVAVLTGATTGYFAFDINPTIFLDSRYVDAGDVVIGLVKSLAFGLAIPLVSAHSGLYASGGSEGVGNATTRAVVSGSLAVIIMGFFIGAIGQAVFG